MQLSLSRERIIFSVKEFNPGPVMSLSIGESGRLTVPGHPDVLFDVP